MSDIDIETRRLEIADQVVPAYRIGPRYYSCSGHIAKQWSAAYEGARIALQRPDIVATPLLDALERNKREREA